MNGEEPAGKKKTVEEILKERGVIKPIPKERIETRPEEELGADSKKILMSLEKIRTELDMLKDEKRETDDRLRDIVESLGEVRSLIFQRETLIKEIESKVKLLDEEISDIRPKRFMKEIDTRRQEIEENQVKIEKLEAMSKELLSDVKSFKEVLENIRSIENLRKTLEEIEGTVSKSREIKSQIDRLAGKAERFYIEMENRIKQFSGLEAKVENLDGLTKEMTRTIDDVNIRLGAFAPKEDLDSFRRTIDDVVLSNRREIEEKIREIESIIKIPPKEIKIKMEELKKKEGTIQKMLENIDDQFHKAAITQNAYNEIKDKNQKLLAGIREEIKKLEGEEEISAKTLPVIIEELYGDIDSVKMKVNLLEKNIGPPQEKGEVTGTLKTQTEMIRNVLDKFKDISQKITDLNKDMRSCSLRIRLFEILDMLIRMESREDISFYISELENTVSEMKAMHIWEKSRGKMIGGLLRDLGQNWKEFGYEEIAGLFEGEIGKIDPEIYKYMENY